MRRLITLGLVLGLVLSILGISHAGQTLIGAGATFPYPFITNGLMSITS